MTAAPPPTGWTWLQALAAALAVIGPCALVQGLHPATSVVLPPPPWGWLAAGLPVAALATAQAVAPQAAWLRGLGGVPLAILALAAAALFAAPTAIWPTGEDAPAWLHRLGLADSTTSLPFAAAYALVTANLAISGARHARAPRPGSWIVVTVHTGLVVCLASAAVGLGNTLRARCWIEEGAPGAARAFVLGSGEPVALPVRIALRDFQLETWEPVLALAARQGDGWQPRPGRCPATPGSHRLGEWRIEIGTTIAQAAVDQGVPRPYPQPGAGPAVQAAASGPDGRRIEGWLHARSPYGPALGLELAPDLRLVMPDLRPKVYRSLIRLDHPDGRSQDAELEVNRPVVVDGWWLYQTGYDEERGGASTRSQIEAVRDPALPGIHLGVGILCLGLLAWLWTLGRTLAQGRLP